MAIAEPAESKVSSQIIAEQSIERTKFRIVEGGVTVALALVFALFCFIPFPNGGQVSLDMLPILLFARIRGVKNGCLAGICYGLVHIIQEPVIFHPLQALLDYPIAYGSLGLAGLASSKKNWDVPFATLGMLSRLFFHTLSGVIFINLFLPSQKLPDNPWLWSLGYNFSFMALPAVVCLILIPIVRKALKK